MSTSDEFAFDYDLLRELTEARGVPGYEDRIREIVRRELAPVTDEIRGDGMGNVVATRHGDADFEVAVAAHMDEIGFMIKHVTEEGFAQLDALGGWDPRVLRAQRVTIHTKEGDVPGVLGSVPPHTMDQEEREKTPEVGDVHVDLGLDGETARERVRPGDLVTMDQRTTVVGEHVTGKALDDRVCLFTMIEAARRLADADTTPGEVGGTGDDVDGTDAEDPQPTIHFAATVQEEVGLRGATALGVDLDPDLAIALDVTVANDVPGFETGEYVTELGEGVAIKLKDSSVITNPKVTDRLRDLAADREIPHQLEVLPAGGTDTAGFQTAAGAKPVGAISVPTRYLHTVTESAHHTDIAAAIDLLTAALETETGEHDYTL